jgi:hypothetical protein
MPDVVKILDQLLEMTDFPSSYAGQQYDAIRVNAGETAVEFVSLGSAQWDHLAAMDQDVGAADDVGFQSISVGPVESSFETEDDGGGGTPPTLVVKNVDHAADAMVETLRIYQDKWDADMGDGFGSSIGFMLADDVALDQVIGHVGFVRDSADNEGKFVVQCGTNGVETALDIDHDLDAHFYGNLGVGTVPTYPLDIRDTAVDTDAPYRGIYNYHVKTAGATTDADDMYGIYNDVVMDQNGGTIGYLRGIYSRARLDDGTVGLTHEDVIGAHFQADIAGGTANDHLIGNYSFVNADGGTVGDSIFGNAVEVDIEAAVTSIGGDVFGHHIQADVDKAPDGAAYMFYLKEISNIDYGVFQDGSADNRLDGNLGLGKNPAGNGPLDMDLTTEDLEIVDAGSVGATQQDWIEVNVGGNQGYIHVHAAK